MNTDAGIATTPSRLCFLPRDGKSKGAVDMKRMLFVVVVSVLVLFGCTEDKSIPVSPQESSLASQSEPDYWEVYLNEDGIYTSMLAGPGGDWDIAEDIENLQGERIRVYQDYESFSQASGELTEIDFEDLPRFGTTCPFGPPDVELPDPLIIEGVVFNDSSCLETCHCTPCSAGQMLLVVNRRGWIDFPDGTGNVGLLFEGMGSVIYTLEVEDHQGRVCSVTGQLPEYGPSFLGFSSSAGISQIRLGQTSNNGPFGFNKVVFKAPAT